MRNNFKKIQINNHSKSATTYKSRITYETNIRNPSAFKAKLEISTVAFLILKKIDNLSKFAKKDGAENGNERSRHNLLCF